MQRSFPSIAVIADAHFHDTSADFGFPGMNVGGERLMLRSWSETRQSTRVFNESADALGAALAEVAARGIRHVVLLGDYTDDGQRETTRTLSGMLERHSTDFGTAFYALPGNHDIFGPQGRHHTKEFLAGSGEGMFVSSDANAAANGVVFSDQMYCEGYPAGLMPMAGCGYFRRPEYLHWETPFGQSDAAEDRLYTVTSPDGANSYRLMDASYLVEPEDGLWLLMIDANVFEPLDGTFQGGEEAAFTDSTSGGWNAMLRTKPFVIDWIADVSRRARSLGKTLLAFSHYPALDPFDGATGAEGLLFGETNVVRRTPQKAVEQALLAAGISIHFSGHLHVEGLTQRGDEERSLSNIAVPSLVAFPAAFKVIHPSPEALSIETVELADLPVSRRLSAAYEGEAARRTEEPDSAFVAETYARFLRRHKRALVLHRYFAKEWPADIVSTIGNRSVLDVVSCLSEQRGALPAAHSAVAGIMMIDLIADWYCLRQGAFLALAHIEPERLGLYRELARRFGREPRDHDGSLPSFLGVFLGALGEFLDRAQRDTRTLTLPIQRRRPA